MPCIAFSMNIQQLFEQQKAYFQTGHTLDINGRIACLTRLKQAICSRESQIIKALQADFAKCPFDTYTTEILMVQNEIDAFIRHLKRWTKPKRVSAGIINWPSRGRIYRQPFGSVLVIAPWNYPFMLALEPLVGAVAAGNCVVLKPSSQTPQTTRVVRKIVSDVFLPEHAAVAEGGHETSDALLALPFDFIFFTGSPSVGKRVMAKAAEHLTPVVLELGGKSPCIVDETANLKTAAERIVWGKFVNAGQTCVAPDYLLVQQSIEQELLGLLRETISRFYYQDGVLSEDFPRIISSRHFDRLSGLLAEGKVFCGGKTESAANRIEPTILTDVGADSLMMQEEIFGPILPVLTYDKTEDAIRFVNRRPKPLALYFFSTDRKKIRTIIKLTSSGGGCINDTVMHVASDRLPFGGVGNSGMGIYHGRYSLETFSNTRSMLHKSPHLELHLKYPPHKPDKIRTLKRLLMKK